MTTSKTNKRPSTPKPPSASRSPGRPGPMGAIPAPGGPSRRTLLLAGLGALAVLILATVAIVLTVGGDDDGGGVEAAGVKQTRPVNASGNPLPPFASAQGDPAVGMASPVVAGTSFEALPRSVGLPGRPAVVTFLAHWCPHCRREVPQIVNWLKESGMPQDVKLLSVATSTSSNQPNYPPSEWLASESWPIEVLADDEEGSAANAFGLSSFPYFVAIDKDAKVVARVSGEIDRSQWEALLNAARGADAGTGATGTP